MGRFVKVIIALVLCLISFIYSSSQVFAAEPHQNPETAENTFSAIALFRYYSGSLDYTIGKNPEEAESRLRKMPFANIPEDIDRPVDEFVESVVSVSYALVDIDGDAQLLREFVEQCVLRWIHIIQNLTMEVHSQQQAGL